MERRGSKRLVIELRVLMRRCVMRSRNPYIEKVDTGWLRFLRDQYCIARRYQGMAERLHGARTLLIISTQLNVYIRSISFTSSKGRFMLGNGPSELIIKNAWLYQKRKTSSSKSAISPCSVGPKMREKRGGNARLLSELKTFDKVVVDSRSVWHLSLHEQGVLGQLSRFPTHCGKTIDMGSL